MSSNNFSDTESLLAFQRVRHFDRSRTGKPMNARRGQSTGAPLTSFVDFIGRKKQDAPAKSAKSAEKQENPGDIIGLPGMSDMQRLLRVGVNPKHLGVDIYAGGQDFADLFEGSSNREVLARHGFPWPDSHEYEPNISKASSISRRGLVLEEASEEILLLLYESLSAWNDQTASKISSILRARKWVKDRETGMWTKRVAPDVYYFDYSTKTIAKMPQD